MIFEPLKLTSLGSIWGAITTDQAEGFGQRFGYIFNPNNRGFFETNDYTRKLYDQDPTGAAILNLAGDVVVPTVLVKGTRAIASLRPGFFIGNNDVPMTVMNKPPRLMTLSEKREYYRIQKELAQRVD